MASQAAVVKLVNTRRSGRRARTGLGVRVPSAASLARPLPAQAGLRCRRRDRTWPAARGAVERGRSTRNPLPTSTIRPRSVGRPGRELMIETRLRGGPASAHEGPKGRNPMLAAGRLCRQRPWRAPDAHPARKHRGVVTFWPLSSLGVRDTAIEPLSWRSNFTRTPQTPPSCPASPTCQRTVAASRGLWSDHISDPCDARPGCKPPRPDGRGRPGAGGLAVPNQPASRFQRWTTRASRS